MNDAIDLLTHQHRDVEKLFSSIEKAKSMESKHKFFLRLADNLAIHAAIEEHQFYPAVKAQTTYDLLLEAVEEHLAVKRILTDLLNGNPDEATFDAQIKVLKEQVEHHVEEEEKELFPKVKKAMELTMLKELAKTMQEEQDDLESKGEPRANIPTETHEAAPI